MSGPSLHFSKKKNVRRVGPSEANPLRGGGVRFARRRGGPQQELSANARGRSINEAETEGVYREIIKVLTECP